MGILDLFRRKHAKAFFEIGGGKGISKDDPIRIRITDWDQAEKAFWATIGKAPEVKDVPPIMAATMVGSMLGETIKMTFLRSVFGEEGAKWTCGNRTYHNGHVQCQQVHMEDGSVKTLWFDFSGCDRLP